MKTVATGDDIFLKCMLASSAHSALPMISNMVLGVRGFSTSSTATKRNFHELRI